MCIKGDKVDSAIRNVVENASLGPEGSLGGLNGALLLDLEHHNDEDAVVSLYPDLKSSFQRKPDDGEHSSSGNWECLIQR